MKLQPNNDFSKCAGENLERKNICGYREQCLRFVRPSGDRQVFSDFWLTGDDCPHYLSIPKD